MGSSFLGSGHSWSACVCLHRQQMELPQEEVLLADSSNDLVPIPARRTPLQRVALVCGCAALVMVGYALGGRQTSLMSDDATISEVGAILTEDDFSSLYGKVIGVAGLTNAELSAINSQITGTGTTTNANVQLLKDWYSAGTDSNKIFANNLIVASVQSPTKAAVATTSTDTVIAKCPIATYAEFGHLYSRETSGKTWARIEQIDSWVRGASPAVGAPLSVRKLRDCYKNTLSAAQRKHFTDSAVEHMKAGAER